MYAKLNQKNILLKSFVNVINYKIIFMYWITEALNYTEVHHKNTTNIQFL